MSWVSPGWRGNKTSELAVGIFTAMLERRGKAIAFYGLLNITIGGLPEQFSPRMTEVFLAEFPINKTSPNDDVNTYLFNMNLL